MKRTIAIVAGGDSTDALPSLLYIGYNALCQ
jgi:hypothetical protein